LHENTALVGESHRQSACRVLFRLAVANTAAVFLQFIGHARLIIAAQTERDDSFMGADVIKSERCTWWQAGWERRAIR